MMEFNGKEQGANLVNGLGQNVGGSSSPSLIVSPKHISVAGIAAILLGGIMFGTQNGSLGMFLVVAGIALFLLGSKLDKIYEQGVDAGEMYMGWLGHLLAGKTPDQQLAARYFVEKNAYESLRQTSLPSIWKMGFDSVVPTPQFPTYQQYKPVLDRCIAMYANQNIALGKVGMDETQVQEIEPSRFIGYAPLDASHFKNVHGNDDWFIKKINYNNAPKLLSDTYEVSWLFLTDEQVVLFSIMFSTVSGPLRTTTREFFYRDVTSFTTDTEMKVQTVGKASQNISEEVFRVIVPGDNLALSMGDTVNADQKVNGLKAKLRDKKSSMV